MKKYVLSAEARAELKRAKEQLAHRHDDARAKREEADKLRAEARGLISLADEFDRTGDVKDTRKMMESETRRKQGAVLNSRAGVIDEEAKTLRAKADAKVNEAGGVVAGIGAEIYDHYRTEIPKVFAPFFWPGREAFPANDCDFLNGFVKWTQRSYEGIENVDSRAREIGRDLDNLLEFGLPSRFGCQIFGGDSAS